jgi:hypothetical protein
MTWLLNWIRQFSPWVVTVTFADGSPQIFAECWKKDVAVQIYEAQRDHIPFNDDAPIGEYNLLTRAEWNQQKAS